ncbi:Crp/Fnr family transcriptional regulator [Bacteroides hominis]|uniref:Crp/Fnr family transcriptional regulator n=1 Tax=Bacteroides hominis TaxID=2763023 RepID=UPI00294A894B|nr:Crp/Fnr family transcriptional regulator [Bacteroides hominis (ex Liu et al. 2022)]MDV6148604.1 Crp/Fnr family transcriptional regulator [Bacteroides hominis (ex Liu et al. 2022)]
MLRTNTAFLTFIDSLYSQRQGKAIILCRKFDKGEQLCSQGSRVRYIHILRQGLVKAYHTEENAKEYILDFFGLGTVLGEEEALAGRSLYLNTVEAMTAVDAYLVSVEHFHYLCDHDHVFCRLLLTEVSRRMADSTARASFYALYPIRYAFEKLLAAQARQNLELSKSDMASYLGIDIRSLNRLLKEHMNERKTPR